MTISRQSFECKTAKLVLSAMLVAVAWGANIANAQVQSTPLVIDQSKLEAVDQAGRIQPQGQVEVAEFFWYGCPHCNAVHKNLEGWSKTLPKEVKYLRIPVNLTGKDKLQQQLYYALVALHREDLHDKVFKTIHQDNNPLNTASKISLWAQSQGINSADWREAFNSPDTLQKTEEAQATFKRFGLNGVPVLVVNGQSAVPAGNLDYAIPRVNHLISQALRSGKATP